MAPQHRVEFVPNARAHLAALKANDRAVVSEAVEQQLLYEPTVETANRKLMRPNQLATWELRIGRFRVYYDVETVPERVVFIRAVGVKERNRVYIMGKVVEL